MNIVLISGFMADASLWEDIQPELEALGRVVHGDVSEGATVGEMARQVLEKAPARFALIGFSMGGYVAREVVRLAPERVQALVLIATSARADTPEQTRRKIAAVKATNPTRFSGLSRSAVIGSLHPDRVADNAMIERVRVMGERMGGEVFMRQAAQERDSDLHRLAGIDCPTLVIAADRDAVRSLDEARELQAGISGAVLTIIEGAGHMIPFERPAALADAVVPWLRRHAGPGLAIS